MYTSGSTGQPKGVACTHRGLVNRIQWSLDLFAASAADSLLPIAAPGFDIALWEMLLPLLAGGRLVLADDRRRKDPVYLAERVEAEGVTLLHFVPSLLRTFVDLVPAGRCGSLRHVACGGEALAAGVSRRFLERFAARLHHWYGPTEAAISVTSWECRRDWAGGALPIGRPIAGARLAVLDEQLRPVPIGVAGEICLGGTPLARGYLGLPDVTAASWVPDPAPGAGGARLYRTGDLARILPDGQLEFAGRLDSQVKIRGHRAEPGEVEAVLLAHPGVAEAVVVAYEPRPEERLLAAYVRLEEERWDGEPRATRAAALERHARRSLPEALVPAPIVVLDRLPLLATGKVDRAALPRPQAAAPPAARVEPASPVELELARIWRDLLQVEEVGVHDSFFDLGGHSLLVISLVHRIAQSFGRARVLQITDIFKRPTIAELARAIEGTVDPRPDTLVALREEGSRIPLVLIHPSEGIVLAYRRLMDFLPDRPLYAINNPHLGDRERAFQSVEDMARCYLGYLRSHFPGDPVCLGGWSFGGVVALEMATQLEAAGDAVAALVLIDSFNFSAFDLEEPADGARWLLARRGIATDTAEGRELAFEIEHSGRLAACYRPGAYAGRVILLSAQHRDPQAAPSLDPYNGWRGVLGREPALYPLPAAHDQLLEPPWVERLAATLEEALADGENPAG
jgi:nocardicin nonribosomal peptide synthetase NocB